MTPSNDPLTAPQARFLAALLTEPTIQAAAAHAGCPLRTAHRWLATPAFQEAYRAAQREWIRQATGQLQQATSQAVETLRRNLACGQPTAEIRAALAILDQAFKATELQDLAARLEALERQLAEIAPAEPTPRLRLEKGGAPE
jgi:hypothetical protein